MSTARRLLRPLLLALLLAGPFVLARFSGGYFDEPRLWAGIVACGLAIAGALLSRRPFPAAAPGRVALAGLALLTAWTAASISWAPLSGRSVPDTDRLLLYLAGLAAAYALLDTRAALRAVEPAVVLGALAVVLYGLSERLLPGVFDLPADPAAFGRLSLPLTYTNAMGSMAAMGCVLAARVAGDVTRRAWLRTGAAAAAPALALGLWLAFSRGATVALLVGLVLMVVLARSAAQLRALAVLVPAGLVAAAVGQSFRGVRLLQGGLADRERDGAIALAVLAAVSLAAALAQRALARREGVHDRAGPRPLSRRARRLVAAALALAVIAGAVFTIAFSEREPKIAPSQASAKRLTSIESNRSAYWKVAIEAFAAHPLRGVGSGGFQVEWVRKRRIRAAAHDAHSLYVETAAELGLVGLVALALFVGGAIWSAARAHARDPAAAAGLAAGLAVWLVHAGLDWMWEMPAVTLPMLLLTAGLMRCAERPAPPAAEAGAPAPLAQPAASSSTA